MFKRLFKKKTKWITIKIENIKNEFQKYDGFSITFDVYPVKDPQLMFVELRDNWRKDKGKYDRIRKYIKDNDGKRVKYKTFLKTLEKIANHESEE